MPEETPHPAPATMGVGEGPAPADISRGGEGKEKESNKTADARPAEYIPPRSILIIGSGVFGLSTALALTRRPEIPPDTPITVVDRSPEPGVFPARDASSIDSSRIIRADYADPAYTRLAAEAQNHWRRDPEDPESLGGGGRYSESGLLLAAELGDDGATLRPDGKPTGLGYTKRSWVNALMLAHAEGRPLSTVRLLPHPLVIKRVTGTDGEWADWGYLNQAAGWADAEKSMDWLYKKVVETGRVDFINGTVEALNTEVETQSQEEGEAGNNKAQDHRVTGARLSDGRSLSADLVIMAAGAWSPSLVDLSGQAIATGQCVAYLRLTEDEQAKLANMPVCLNLTDGCFIIPPRDCVLKIARHSYGYLNPQAVPNQPLKELPASSNDRTASAAQGSSPQTGPEEEEEGRKKKKAIVSQPRTHLTDSSLEIPAEGAADLRRALRRMIPWPELADRPFFKTRLCWYTDTATGDWIIDYHPSYKNLFVATGGSGHAFKFLPILGDKVVDCLVGRCPQGFREKWKWKGGLRIKDRPATKDGGSLGGLTEAYREDLAVEHSVATEDGSRGGKAGQILEVELSKSGRT
ncbi:DAO-domain-containing protein [Xylariaceae sp. FL0594]|nr:DAO-domain-containing protein [Xylariaceae sp. FL0594]